VNCLQLCVNAYRQIADYAMYGQQTHVRQLIGIAAPQQATIGRRNFWVPTSCYFLRGAGYHGQRRASGADDVEPTAPDDFYVVPEALPGRV
jgi:hypothetical protein